MKKKCESYLVTASSKENTTKATIVRYIAFKISPIFRSNDVAHIPKTLLMLNLLIIFDCPHDVLKGEIMQKINIIQLTDEKFLAQ